MVHLYFFGKQSKMWVIISIFIVIATKSAAHIHNLDTTNGHINITGNAADTNVGENSAHTNLRNLPECDLSQASIEYCNTEITSTWNITQHTNLNQVNIVCSTYYPINCINLGKGVNLNMMSVLITSNNDGNCIHMEESTTLTANDLTANNCEWSGNGHKGHPGGFLYGSYDSGSIAVTLKDSRIHDSQGHSGGAISLYYGNLTLENTSFMGSKSGRHAGAIELYGGYHMFTNSKLQYNTAYGYGGAVTLEHGGELTLKDTIIEHNSAASLAGAIKMDASVLHLMSGNSIAHNEVTGEPESTDIWCHEARIQQNNAETTITCV